MSAPTHMQIGSTIFSREECLALERVVTGTPAGDTLVRILIALMQESKDLLVSDLSEKDTNKARGAVQTLEALVRLLTQSLSSLRDSVNAPIETGTNQKQE